MIEMGKAINDLWERMYRASQEYGIELRYNDMRIKRYTNKLVLALETRDRIQGEDIEPLRELFDAEEISIMFDPEKGLVIHFEYELLENEGGNDGKE